MTREERRLTLVAFLEKVVKEGGRRAPVARLLLGSGKLFPHCQRVWETAYMPRGNCFQNAYEICSKYRELFYVEGFCVADRVYLHAFLTDADGNTHDPTWPIGEVLRHGLVFSTTFAQSVIDPFRHKERLEIRNVSILMSGQIENLDQVRSAQKDIPDALKVPRIYYERIIR